MERWDGGGAEWVAVALLPNGSPPEESEGGPSVSDKLPLLPTAIPPERAATAHNRQHHHHHHHHEQQQQQQQHDEQQHQEILETGPHLFPSGGASVN